MINQTDNYRKPKQPSSWLVSLICAGFMAALASPLVAQNVQKVSASVTTNIWKDIGASERIDLSGRLHMLSQRIAASTCSLEAGVDADISKGIMAGSAAEMDRIMDALTNGNPLMKIIGAEDDPRVMASINRVNDNWQPVRAVLADLHANGTSAEGLSAVRDWNVPYFEFAQLLVSEIAAEYANPADLLQRDAILVDLAGRQRMRTQKMLKQACETLLGRTKADELTQTVGVFERTLDALLNGAPQVGISKAPTPGLDASLRAIDADWQQIKPVMVTITQGGTLTSGSQTALMLRLNELLIKSNGVVTMYTKHAKNAY
ncbi:MAG: type IV pili methyl-accepting chemotaxis transducer N-terminal domain-containing protein [Pseudomonadota bacterium]